MKVIIIDDETHARDGIRLLGDWEQLGIEEILEADNVDTAKKIIKQHKPEIIITDMNMPMKSGIDLMKSLQQLSQPHKIIVISGYDDYKYTRKTIQYGGFDYLMKPLDEDELNEALTNAISELRITEKDSIVATSVYDDQRMSDIFSGNSTTIPEYIKDYFDSVNQIRIITIELELNVHHSFFEGNTHSRYLQFKKIMNEHLLKKKAISFYYTHLSDVLIMIYPDNSYSKQEISEIYYSIKKYTKNLSFYVSECGSFPQDLVYLFNESLSISKRRNLYSKKHYSIYYTEDTCNESWNIVTSLSNLKLFIISGNFNQVYEELKLMFEKIEQKQCFNLEQIIIWEEELASLYRQFTKSDANSNNRTSSINYLNTTGKFSNEVLFDSLCKELMGLIEKTNDKKQKKNINEEMNKVKEFIEENYKKTLKTSDIADHLYISREYLSRQFKKATKMTVGDYIMEVRLKHAEYLLETTNLKISDIAYQSGFSDESYFSRVFKKYRDLSPNQYRNKSVK
ncbi:response regulator [Radiobacillus sp. PE A8.2]|uniref:response regulator transcription factor n=1 Tax=Radiobacillus sp. PE A8.2 TaxID=3380349 RepID=UPI00388E0830